MPDIQLRFQKDMLVLSAPVDATLARQGIDVARDREYLNLMEPDVMSDALQLEVAAGAQCVVTTTEDITKARLAHVRMDADAPRLAQAALSIAGEVRPQHILAEIGPCGLPLDASSKSSLNENRAQYADAARAFGDGAFDAFFLNGFVSVPDLKCALMGVAQVSEKPVFASVALSEDGRPFEGIASALKDPTTGKDEVFGFPFEGFTLVDDAEPALVPPSQRTCLDAAKWPEAIEAMVDLGADVVGFETSEPIAKALEYVRVATAQTDRPLLAQLRVSSAEPHTKTGLVPLEDIDEYTPDTMATAAVKLFGAGVQFLRATGAATPAYTGALAATVTGLDVHRS